MPTYILLSTLTPEGRQTLHKNPDRLEEVNKEIADFGCTVVAQYGVLGPYDFVSIIEAPDNETIAHLSVDLNRTTQHWDTATALPSSKSPLPPFRKGGPRGISCSGVGMPCTNLMWSDLACSSDRSS